jgi:epoxide hydrolase-like predicted phosphatase
MKNKKEEIKRKVKFVIFDVGGVLALTNYAPHPIKGHMVPGVHHYMAKKLKIDLDSWFDSIDTAYAKSIEGKMPREKVLKIISKNLGISKEKLVKLSHKSYKKNFKDNRKLYSIAYKLKKKGYKIGILSDQWYLSQDILMSKKKVKGFNPVIVSCEVGLRKPNPKIYKLLIKRCKCMAKDILFIDNRDWNLKPAKKLGMKTILFKNNKQLIKELKKRI